MEKIYAAVYGSGLGHVTRVYAIAQELKKENRGEFLYSCFDEGLDFLRKHHERVLQSPSIGLKWNMSGGFSGSDTFLRSPKALLSFSKQVGFEMDGISRFGPRVVLSDSRLSAILAAKSKSCPVITILNQFKILFPPRFRRKRISNFYERIEGDVLGTWWSLSNELLFPDLPPPYTIGEANIAGTDVANRVKFIGFMTPKIDFTPEHLSKVRSALQFDSRPLVFVQISGPNPTKHKFVDVALKSSKILSENYNVVISMGNPLGSTSPTRLGNGVLVYEWCPIKDELFLLSDLLVARSGHTTISQCIDSSKPAVVIPIYNHSEQIWNGEKFSKLGLGITMTQESLDSKKLIDAVSSCLENKYKRNVEKLRRISEKYNGIEEATRTVKTFL